MSDEMKKTEMLKKNYEFKNVLDKGKYFGGDYIEAFVIKNETPKNQLGIAISKKIGKATIKNNIKRLIRENYRLLEEEIKTGYSLVILWKKQADIQEAKFHNIEKDLIKILDKAGMREQNSV